MKILFISGSFYPSIGGVETHALEVARELVKRGHKVSVITEDKQSQDESDSKAKKQKSNVKSTLFTRKRLDQIDIYYFKFGQESRFKKFRIWYYLIKNIKFFEEADIIHAHDVFFWYLPIRFLLMTKKVFTTFHGYETVFPPAEKAKFIRGVSKSLSMGTINVGAFIEKWYGTSSDYITYGGVKKIKNSNVKIKNIVKPIKILLIGRLEKDIGVLVYRDALRMLRDKGVEFTLTVLGEGSLRPEIESYGEIYGFAEDISSYVKESDIVFSSSYLTMLQVMQYKKPIFAVYTNPLKHDYLRNSPFEEYITISGNAEDLAQKIMRVRPNRKRLIDGASFANSQTWEKVADTYLELWSKE